MDGSASALKVPGSAGVEGGGVELEHPQWTASMTASGRKRCRFTEGIEFIAVGDTFVVTAGCDKRFATCRDRFNNAANFRGFPHIPGNDFIIRIPNAGEPGNDGTPFVRS